MHVWLLTPVTDASEGSYLRHTTVFTSGALCTRPRLFCKPPFSGYTYGYARVPCTDSSTAHNPAFCRHEVQVIFAQVASGFGRDPVLHAEANCLPASSAAARVARTLNIVNGESYPPGKPA